MKEYILTSYALTITYQWPISAYYLLNSSYRKLYNIIYIFYQNNLNRINNRSGYNNNKIYSRDLRELI